MSTRGVNQNTKTSGPTARKLRRAEDKERAILNKETSVTGKDTDAEMKKRISSKAMETGEKMEEEVVENKKGKGYLKGPVDATKRVD